MKKKEEMKVKVDVEEPKDKKEETAEKLPKPTVKELQQNNKLTIPFNRQQLADFLAVDRSAMSGELSKMQADGLIRYKKNNFELLQK